MSIRVSRCITLYCASVLLMTAVSAEDRALLVGINAYNEKPLEGCKKDADQMYQLIQKVWDYKPNQIHRLTDRKATRRAILSEIDNWLIAGTQPGDRVLFYYSGHGYHLPDDNGDEPDGQDEVLCPVDSQFTSSDVVQNAIRDDEINTRLQQLAGRQVIFISDSCHSGTMTRAFGQPNQRAKRPFFKNAPRLGPATRSIGRPEPGNTFVSPLNHVIAYSAVSPSQVALDGGPQGGVFTNLFIKAIRNQAADRNKDGQVTHAEVLDYVRKESQAYCDRTGECTDNNGHLTPQLDANPKWLAQDVRARSAVPPPPSSSPQTTLHVAQILESENAAQLKTQMLPSTTFQLGQQMQINVSSQHTGYLFVLDIDSQGKLTVLFPNEYSNEHHRKGLLHAGQTVKIPDISYGFDFIAQEPTGQGLLLALLLEEDETFVHDFQRRLPISRRGFGVIKSTSQVQMTLQWLYQQLHQTLLEPNGVGRPIKWSMVDIEYEIRP